MAAILDENKSPKLIYIYGPESQNTPSYVIHNNTSYKILHDPGLGSVRYIIEPTTQQIVQEIEYDEFGNMMKNSNPDFQPILFSGGLYDFDTKLYRFGARDYDPTVGRWTTKDPIGFAGGDTNLYAYVGGNPMSYIDPSGLKTVVRQFGSNAGHIAISVDNSPFFGFYPSGNFIYSAGIVKNDSLRTDVEKDVVLNTTPAEEKKILEALLDNNGKPYAFSGPNCTTRASDALKAGGINSSTSSIPAIFIKGEFGK